MGEVMRLATAFATAVLLGAVLSPISGRAGRTLGLVDLPGPGNLKIHRRAIPLSGGAAVLLAAALTTWIFSDGLAAGPWVAALIAFVVGTLDDRRPLRPLVRVGGVVVAAVALVLLTQVIRDAGAEWWVGTALIVLVCANAVNILDGQDGLAGGVASVGGLGLAAVGWIGGGTVPVQALAVGGGLAGFLVWNRPPARIFLGNGGAYAVGVLLGFEASRIAVDMGWRGLLAAGACLAVPAFEVVFTVARRAAARESLSAGDRSHSYDLVSARLGRGRSTVAFVGLGLVGAGFGVLITIVPLPAGIALALGGVAAASLWGVRLWSRRPITT
jgi:UDP-GlcNAc:undecaprenyl-phosphate GlcNAc-1-phosphate transferase